VVAASDASSDSKQAATYVCDGINDEIEIQRAIDDLPSIGGMVQLTEGIFNLNRSGATQILLSNGTWLKGLGQATQLILGASIDQTVISNENATPGTELGTHDKNITVGDMYIDGNKENQGAGADTLWCVGFSSVDNLRIFGMYILRGYTVAIRTEFCKYVLVENNIIEDAADDGIAINEETKFASVVGNIIRDSGQNKSYGSPFGIEVQDGAEDITIEANVVEYCSSGGLRINLHAGKPQCVRVVARGNIFKNNGDGGIAVDGESGTNHEHISISGNTILENLIKLDAGGPFTSGTFQHREEVTQAGGSGAKGIVAKINTAGNDYLLVEVTANTFDTSGLVTGGTSTATMTPSTTSGDGTALSSSHFAYGEFVGNSIEAGQAAWKGTLLHADIIFANNVCQGDGTAEENIRLNGTLDRIRISNNNLSAGDWRGILFDSAAVPTGCHITNNTIWAQDHGSGGCVVWDMTSAVGANNILGENYLDGTIWAKTKETGSYVTGVPTNWTDRNNTKV